MFKVVGEGVARGRVSVRRIVFININALLSSSDSFLAGARIKDPIQGCCRKKKRYTFVCLYVCMYCMCVYVGK